MHFDHQLKRGYLAFIGIIALGFALVVAPELSASQTQTGSSRVELTACKTSRPAHWNLAATPADIPPFLLSKTAVCRA